MQKGYLPVSRLGTLAEIKFVVVETLSNHRKRATAAPPAKLKLLRAIVGKASIGAYGEQGTKDA